MINNGNEELKKKENRTFEDIEKKYFWNFF